MATNANLLGADDTTGAGLILDNKRLIQLLCQSVGQQARDEVGFRAEWTAERWRKEIRPEIINSPWASTIGVAQRFKSLTQCVTRTLPGAVPMSILTIRLPDDKHERLKALARSNAISVNKLMDELATVALANFDARVRFETRAARGNPKRALKLLDKLDRAE